MKTKYLIKIFSSIYQIGYNVTNNINHKIGDMFEQHFIKGKYVTREEYDILKEQFNKLRNKNL